LPIFIIDKKSIYMDRREFIEKVGLMSLTGLAAGSMISTFGCKAPASLYTKSVFEGNKVKIVKSDWPPAAAYVVVQHPTNEHPIYIHKEGNDYMALHMECTHRGCGLKAEATQLTCPCHGSKFDTRGQVTEGPAKKPLVSYRTTSDPNTVFVEIL